MDSVTDGPEVLDGSALVLIYLIGSHVLEEFPCFSWYWLRRTVICILYDVQLQQLRPTQKYYQLLIQLGRAQLARHQLAELRHFRHGIRHLKITQT